MGNKVKYEKFQTVIVIVLALIQCTAYSVLGTVFCGN